MTRISVVTVFAISFSVDLRSLAEPVAGILFLRGFLRHDFNGDLTLRLGDALRGGLTDSARGDRSAGDGIHLSGLTGKQRLLQFHGGLLPNPGGFMRRVNHDIRDLIRVKRHRNDDIAADTGGLRGIRAGLIDTGGGSRVSESGRGDGSAADEARAEELTTRELSHGSCFLEPEINDRRVVFSNTLSGMA